MGVIHTSVMGELKSSFFIIVWMFIEVSSGNMSKKIQLSDNSCCEQIRLGNATYVFSHIENETSRFHCVSKCVYSKRGEPKSRYCFRCGGEEQPSCSAALDSKPGLDLLPEPDPKEEDEEQDTGANKNENAVLIVGGSAGKSAVTQSEVFFPRTGKGCLVPEYEFPGGASGATLNTVGGETLLCGGVEYKAECYEFTPSNANVWTKYADLNKTRYQHTAWESSQGLVLIGGFITGGFPQDSRATAELVRGGIMNFSLPDTRFSCAITDTATDSVILTGGLQTSTKVSRYNQNGLVEELPILNHGRHGHSCGSYKDKMTDTLVLIVAGGRPEFNDGQWNEQWTTEKYVVGDNKWKVIKPLPSYPLSGGFLVHQEDTTVSINNKIFIFGGGYNGGTPTEDSLEFDSENEEWKKVGDMQLKRLMHATAPIKADQEKLCGAG